VPPLGGTVGDGTGQDEEAAMTAPLQVIALSFSHDTGSGDRILAEVDRLRGRGVLRLLDMLFVTKSQDGTIERLAMGDDEDFGSLLAAVVPLTRPMRGRWPIPFSQEPLWPSCSSSTTGPRPYLTPSPRPAAC
jgi:hypothetical protein